MADCIDRERALAILKMSSTKADAESGIMLLTAEDVISVRRGKWVDENGNRPYGYRFNWLCSECGRPQHTSTAKLLKEFEEEHRWCHFCGARMDGDHDKC